MQLSPLNKMGVICRSRRVENEQSRGKGRVEEVVMYRCPVCDQLHEDEDDAEECCEFNESNSDTNCPVCGEKYNSHRDAADCCLWKDIPALKRWEIADAVEAGSDWQTELGLSPLSS